MGSVDFTHVQKTLNICCVHKSSGTKQTAFIKVKAGPLHARRGRGTALTIINLGARRRVSGQGHAPVALPLAMRPGTPRTVQGAGGASGPV